MIDLILFVFFLAVFYGAFWCGSKYGTLKKMWGALWAMVGMDHSDDDKS